MTCAALLLFASASTGRAAAQTVNATQPEAATPIGVRVDRFAAATQKRRAVLAEMAIPDTVARPQYTRMGLAGLATGIASIYLTVRLLEGSGLRQTSGVTPQAMAAFPGTVLVPVAVHYANGGRGALQTSLGASLAVFAGASLALGPTILALPAIQVPVSMLIETATMSRIRIR